MKKTIVLLITALLFVGCSNKDNITKCILVSDQSASGYKVTTDYEVYSTDGIVDKVEILEVVSSKDKNILDFFQKQNENQYKTLNDKYGGYTYKIITNNNKVISTVTVDYKMIDMKSFVNDNKGMENYIDSDNKVTLDGIKKMYINIGATCK